MPRSVLNVTEPQEPLEEESNCLAEGDQDWKEGKRQGDRKRKVRVKSLRKVRRKDSGK